MHRFLKKKNLITICFPKLVILREKTSNLRRHLGPKIWIRVQQVIKESTSLNEFKNLIKFWKPDTSLCRL